MIARASSKARGDGFFQQDRDSALEEGFGHLGVCRW
jgi:hypothetical protein